MNQLELKMPMFRQAGSQEYNGKQLMLKHRDDLAYYPAHKLQLHCMCDRGMVIQSVDLPMASYYVAHRLALGMA